MNTYEQRAITTDSNGNDAGRVVAEIGVSTITGVLHLGEVLSPATAAAQTISIPAGIKAITVSFDNAVAAQAAGDSTMVYLGFNNTSFFNVNAAGFRRVVPLGKVKTFQFTQTPLPTEITFLSNSNEGALGDTIATWEAVSNV